MCVGTHKSFYVNMSRLFIFITYIKYDKFIHTVHVCIHVNVSRLQKYQIFLNENRDLANIIGFGKYIT